MNQSTWRAFGLVVVFAWWITGCEAPLPATPPGTDTSMTAAAAWTEWQQIAVQNQADWDADRAASLTAIMASSPGGLSPMISAIGDTSIPAHAKVLALICLMPIRQELIPYAEDINGLTTSERSQGVRTFGTHLLGLVESDSAITRVTALLDDPDRPVREAAMGVLVMTHGNVVADRLNDFWKDPETTPEIRDQIVLGMAPELVEQFVPIFADAVLDRQLNAGARYKAATILGQIGNAAHIALLQECAESDPDSYVRDRAQGGLAMLRSNEAAPPSGVESSQ